MTRHQRSEFSRLQVLIKVGVMATSRAGGPKHPCQWQVPTTRPIFEQMGGTKGSKGSKSGKGSKGYSGTSSYSKTSSSTSVQKPWLKNSSSASNSSKGERSYSGSGKSWSKGKDKGKGKGKGKGKKGGSAPRADSPFWQEKLAEENRVEGDGTEYTGVIKTYSIKQGWGFIEPDDPDALPDEVREKIDEANSIARDQGKRVEDTVQLYFRKPDLEEGYLADRGHAVTFQVYTDDKGAGAYAIAEA